MAAARTAWIVGGVLALLLVAGAAYGLLVVDRPRIEAVENDWGNVTPERTEVETELVVENPTVVRVGDAVADVRYTVSLNDVVIATERERRVRLSGRRNVVEVSTWMDNDDVPDWWVTHVNQNQTTTVRVDPTVALEYGGVRFPAGRLTRARTVHTSLLEPLRVERNRRVEAFGRTVLVVNETDASFGRATANRTPIRASATVTNPTSVSIPITEVAYTIRMNGVVVGNGTAARAAVVPPGSTRTLDASATIDNSALDEWWVTHVRNDETTRLTVEFDALLRFGGVERRVPLDALSYNQTVTTDVFGPPDGGAVDGNGSAARIRPRVRPAPKRPGTGAASAATRPTETWVGAA